VFFFFSKENVGEHEFENALCQHVQLCTLLETFRLDYEYDFRFQISDVSRALALHVGFRQRG